MSRDMEGVYQTKVTEKLQKLEESKQNVNILFKKKRKNIFKKLEFRF
jgi:hypothetical protein